MGCVTGPSSIGSEVGVEACWCESPKHASKYTENTGLGLPSLQRAQLHSKCQSSAQIKAFKLMQPSVLECISLF